MITGISIGSFSEDKKPPVTPVILDEKFYAEMMASDPIKRDLFLDKILNKIVQGRGYVESVTSRRRYDRNFRIAVRNKEKNHNVLFYIYSDNDQYVSVLSKDDPFEFKGQFIIYTAVTSKRDLYIFDIILEDGAVVVE
jgi:hypothetical protein